MENQAAPERGAGAEKGAFATEGLNISIRTSREKGIHPEQRIDLYHTSYVIESEGLLHRSGMRLEFSYDFLPTNEVYADRVQNIKLRATLSDGRIHPDARTHVLENSQSIATVVQLDGV